MQDFNVKANGTADDFDIYLGGDVLDCDSSNYLELLLANTASVVEARLPLLYYYAVVSCDVDSWIRHLTWMIENRPQDWINCHLAFPHAISDEHFASVVDVWKRIVSLHQNDAIVIGNFGEFLSYRDFEQARILLNKAIDLQPQSLQFKYALWRNYLLQVGRKITANRENFDILVELTQSLVTLKAASKQGYGILTDVCATALDKGYAVEAQIFADALLVECQSQDAPHRMFIAWCFVGRAKLLANDLDGAKSALSNAAAQDFFPTFTLADELVQKGEKDFVLSVYKTCLPGSIEASAQLAAKISQWQG